MGQTAQWLAWMLALTALTLALALVQPGLEPPPRLVVLLAIDQLRADYITRFESHYSGGLRWLLERGAYFADASYRHSSTVTAAGHATIATGMHPSTHGIVGNSWREAGRGEVYCVSDDRFAAVGGPGDGASPHGLLADTLGDTLKESSPESVVYSLSTKDRSAVLLGGRSADGAFWYSPDCGCLVSSTYYDDALPGWLREFNHAGPASSYAGREWTRLGDDIALYERLARADSFPTEGGGTDSVFPHSLSDTDFESTLTATPFSDEIVLDAALAAVRSGELGADAAPDLLAIGLSATDAIGHRYGPFSQEAMDNHLRLDRRLGEFLSALDEEVGLERVAIALTADHGALPLVEHLAAAGVDALRLSTEEFWGAAQPGIESCGSGAIAEIVDNAGGSNLYWNDAGLSARGVSRLDASKCVAELLRSQPVVEQVWIAEQLAAGGGHGAALLFENSYFASRSPHLQVQFRPHVYPGRPTGTGHGTAHDYDRRVPVLLAGSGIAPGRYRGVAGPEDVAPTLGIILGLDMGLERDTRVLREALRRRSE
ncbi:MAG: alkaline phosphatase family protein [Acidobacteriia bacterium]|nr:alkaline phosphatase family protein [Terriglobia bacterium]MYG01839.1 alkaline phosphatase family protein [Terriglobia bacterium]MYK10170.1 alkaline phosphatase family protein [Terriglobia bacterium]